MGIQVYPTPSVGFDPTAKNLTMVNLKSVAIQSLASGQTLNLLSLSGKVNFSELQIAVSGLVAFEIVVDGALKEMSSRDQNGNPLRVLRGTMTMPLGAVNGAIYGTNLTFSANSSFVVRLKNYRNSSEDFQYIVSGGYYS